jgi:hypothetical protein
VTSVRSRIPARPGRRPKPCRVCELPTGERDLVNGGLLSGWSPRRLAARFGTLNRRAVAFHAKNCVASSEKEEECEQ